MSASVPATGLRERHKQQRRERILEAIRELLRESPNETPTVERIAELADLSPATVFNLVGPREQQWAALWDALLRELDACLALAADEDPREQARRIVGDTAELFISDAAVYRHLVNTWGRGGSLLQEDPIPQLRAALADSAAQFVRFGTGEGMEPQEWVLLGLNAHNLNPDAQAVVTTM